MLSGSDRRREQNRSRGGLEPRAAWRRLAISLLVFGLAAGLGGCDSMPKGLADFLHEPQPAAGQPAAQPVAGKAIDPMLDFAATAYIGKSATITDPTTHDTLTVQVTSAYDAASGRQCREYQVSARARSPQTRLICDGPEGWTPVRPLISEGPPPPPGHVARP